MPGVTIIPPPSGIVWKYLDADRALEVLRTGKVWFASPLTFNDPFDTQWNPFWHLRGEAFAEETRRCIRRLRDGDCGDVPEWIPGGLKDLRLKPRVWEILEETMCSMAQKQFVVDWEGTVKGMLERTRLLSVCQAGDCPPMWAHYGKNHTGFALGFEADTLLFHTGTRKVVTMEYADSLPRVFRAADAIYLLAHGLILPGASSGWPDHINSLVCEAMTRTKSDLWAYEKEVRYGFRVSDTDKGTLRPFGPALRHVVIGLESAPRTVNDVRNAVKQGQTGAQVHLASKSASRFAIECDPPLPPPNFRLFGTA